MKGNAMSKWRFFLFSLFLIAIPVIAQDEACQALLDAVLSRTLLACGELADGDACYGNASVEVSANEGASLSFENAGDRAAIEDIASFELSAANSADESWGTVVLRQDTVTSVIFGAANFEPATGHFRASGESDCENTPPQILLFGAEESSTTINGVEISFSGIVLLSLDADGMLNVYLLGGMAEITAVDGTVSLETDTMTSLVLGEDGLAAETPSDASEYEGEALNPYFSLYSFSGGEDYPLPIPPASTIIPRSGRWQLMRFSGYQYNACPGATMGSPEGRVDQEPDPEIIVDFDFSEGFSIQTFVEQQTGFPPPEAVYINPIPNLYKAFDYSETPPIEFWLTVVSDSNIVSTTIYYVDQDREVGSCGVISFNYWEWIGESE
jgi:hypothetical protein